MWSPHEPDFSKHVASTFLISSWHELFYAFTPDSNQPRLHNVPSLIDELADISEHWQKEHRFQSHIEKIRKELEQALDEEDDILGELPEYRSRAQSLANEGSSVRVLTGCQILVEHRDQYERACIEAATEAIDALPKKKQAAHKCIRRLATFAFQCGKEDNDVWAPLNKDPSREPGEIFREVVGLSAAESKEYQCTLAVVGSLSEIHSAIRMNGLSPVAQSKLPGEYLTKITEPSKQLMFVGFDVRATSIRNAVADSRKKLGIVTCLVSLYQNSPSLHVHPMALIHADGSDVVFSQSEQAFRRLHPRSRAVQDIREALDLLKKHKVDEHLLGAIELLSLASSSSDSRARLINFWSSIETLAGGHEGSTTFDRVKSLVVPLIISRHVGRTVRYLAIETQQLGSLLGRSDYGSGFPRSSETFVAPPEMLKTLAAPENSQPICDLLKFAEHPLLRYRIYRSWKTIHDPKKLSAMLALSKKRLEWHIARIYRARNLLVHQGVESPFQVPLLDNLQNYISMAVQRLIHELKMHPEWNVRHAIEYWKGKMEHILKSLDRHPSVLTVDDFIDGKAGEKIWPSH